MMVLNFQCRTDTAIWTGGYATPPVVSDSLEGSDASGFFEGSDGAGELEGSD